MSVEMRQVRVLRDIYMSGRMRERGQEIDIPAADAAAHIREGNAEPCGKPKAKPAKSKSSLGGLTGRGKRSKR